MSQAATDLRPHACRDSAGVKRLRKEVICRVLPLAADSAGDVRSACATALASFAPLLTSDAPGQFQSDLLGAEKPTKAGDAFDSHADSCQRTTEIVYILRSAD